MKGKHWRKTTLMPGSKKANKQSNNNSIQFFIIIIISLTQIYVAIEN
jgi:hypothetical protein